MTNGEKYRTAKERAEAFDAWVRAYPITKISKPDRLAFVWMDLESPAEEPLPCPFCGEQTSVAKYGRKNDFEYRVVCDCSYLSPCYNSPDDAIRNHNRVARAAKEKEANDANA